MKKVLTFAVATIMLVAFSSQVFARNLESYKWKAKRASSYCRTTITSIYGLKTTYTYQVWASSKGSGSDGAFNQKKANNLFWTPDLEVEDSRKPSGSTYHNTSVNDGYGWCGQSCYMTKNATSTLTRTA